MTIEFVKMTDILKEIQYNDKEMKLLRAKVHSFLLQLHTITHTHFIRTRTSHHEFY